MAKLSIDEIGHLYEIRQRLGLDEADTSKDDMILKMDPLRRVAKIAGWYLGDEEWAYTFKRWCESQGLYMTKNPDADGVIE